MSQGLVTPAPGGLSASYLGQVATRCGFANGPANFRQQMNETFHYLRDDVTAVQVAWANCYAATGAETSSGGTLNITASIKAPSGSWTRLTFGGVNQGAIADRGYLWSDLIPFSGRCNDLVSVRSYVTNSASNIVYNASSGIIGKDKMVFANSGVADDTMTGAVLTATSPTSPFCYTPVAIRAYTRKASVAILLDSIAFLGGNTPDAMTDSFYDLALARPFGPEMAYCNLAIPSATLQGLVAGGTGTAVRAGLLGEGICSHGFNNGGTNDMGSRTAAQMGADRSSIATTYNKLRWFGATILPRTTSTDAWVTTTNQTVTAAETVRTTFNNTYVRGGGIAGEVGYFDLADALESDRDSGKVAVGYLPGLTSGVANMDDGLHPNTKGYIRIRNSGVVRPSYMKR